MFTAIFGTRSVALDTVCNIADAFFCMLGNKLVSLVFMTTIAGVGFELVALVTSHARNIVLPVELEIPIVSKIGGLPTGCCMALVASSCDRPVQPIIGLGMASDALISDARL